MSYTVYGETEGVYFPWIEKTFARNVSEKDVEAVVAYAREHGWRNVRYSVEAF